MKKDTIYRGTLKFFSPDGNQIGFLVFFRVMIGVVALVDILSLWPDLSAFYGESARWGPNEILYIQSASFQYMYLIDQYIDSAQLPFDLSNFCLILYVVGLLFLIAGFRTRLTSFLLLILHFYIYKSFNNLNYGFDYFMSMSIFYCLLFPVGKVYAIDAVFSNKPYVPKFNYRNVLKVHIAIAYFYTGLAKVLDPGWWEGVSLWKALASVDSPYYSLSPYLLVLGGIGTVLLELSHPILIWFRRTEYIALVSIVIMHLCIAYMMNLASFSAIMIIWNISALADFQLPANAVSKVPS